jgi:putative heme-binding domain-containing protein
MPAKLLMICAGLMCALSAQTNSYTAATDVELGRKLYTGYCGHCHGLGGEGGRGSVLNTGQLRHGGSDRELFAVIRNGIAGTEMRGSFLPEPEIWRMVTYVKQLGRRGTSDAATGDPAAGASIYKDKGCAGCHTVNGHGGFLGPDLTTIGAKRSVRHLRESIVNPDADVPLDYRVVAVVTSSGSTVRGIHVNEDEYAVHLRDMSGNLRTFLKREIKEVKLPRQSVMPASQLSPTDLENLTAYLASLRTVRAGANQ